MLGSFLIKRMYKDVIEGYKKDTDKWFNSYLEMVKWYHEMKQMYYQETFKNLGK